MVALALCKALRVRVLLDTTTGQDIRGESAAALIEAAEEGAPERTLIAVGSRGLGAVQRLRVGSISTKVLRTSKEPLLIVHRDRRETRGEPGPWRNRRSGGARCLRAWTPVRRRLGAAGRLTQDGLAILAPHDACRTLRSQGRHGTRGRPIALHNIHRPLTSPAPDSNIHTAWMLVATTRDGARRPRGGRPRGGLCWMRHAPCLRRRVTTGRPPRRSWGARG